MAVAAIIAAAIAGGTGLISSALDNQAAERAQMEARRLAERRRLDELAYKNEQKKISEFNKEMTKKQLAFQKKQFAFQKGEAIKDRAERAEEKGYQRAQMGAQRIADQVNQNAAFRNNFMNIWSRQ